MRSPARLFISCAACIVLSQLFFAALQWFSFEKEYRRTILSPYREICTSLARDVESGFDMGKTLTRFQAFPQLADIATRAAPHVRAVALVQPDGAVAQWHGDDPRSALRTPRISSIPEMSGGQDDLAVMDAGPEAHMFKALKGSAIYLSLGLMERDAPAGPGDHVGYLALVIDKELYAATLDSFFSRMLIIFGVCTLALLAILPILLRVVSLRDAQGRIRRKRLVTSVLLPLLLVQTACSILLLSTAHEATGKALRDITRQHAFSLAGKIQHILDMGVGIDEMGGLEDTLRQLRAMSPELGRIAIEDLSGAVLHASGSEPGPDSGQAAVAATLHDGATGRQTATVKAWADPGLLASSLKTSALDTATAFVISLLLMGELAFMLLALLGGKRQEGDMPAQRGVLRGIAFWLLVALDMSLSFIPLRMKELATSASAGSSDFLLGLPVSAEMGAAGLAVLAAGAWAARRAPAQPLHVGIALAALGSLGSAFCAGSAWYVLSRAVVGFGYGLGIMSLQNLTVSASPADARGASIASMFAGVYAGGLCGSAMGAMLADRVGYAVVFSTAAALLGLLLLVSLASVGRWKREHARKKPPRASLASVRGFLLDGKVLSLLALSLFPGAVVTVGLVNYLIPLSLNKAGTSQSDIGRVLMAFSLAFICLSPLVAPRVERLSRKALAITLGGCLGGACLLILALPQSLLPPYWSALASVTLLGFFLAVCVTAQSSFLLGCRATTKIGSEQALSLSNAVERLGQVAGPLVFGAAMLLVQPERFALMGGLVFIVCSAAFLLATRERN